MKQVITYSTVQSQEFKATYIMQMNFKSTDINVFQKNRGKNMIEISSSS